MSKHEERAIEISKALKDWFKEVNRNEAKPEDIMPFLYERGIFNEGKRDDALQLRKLLRRLHEEGKLDLIEEARFEQKKKNKSWSFVRND